MGVKTRPLFIKSNAFLTLFIFVLFSINIAEASESCCQNSISLDITAQEFEEHYQKLKDEKTQLETHLSAQSLSYLTNVSTQHQKKVTKKQKPWVQRYRAWERDWKTFMPVAKFRDDLIQTYFTKYGQTQNVELKNEATRIALTLFSKTKQLKKQFRMSSIPTWQNIQIDLKMKSRGECHHWARDLLEFLKPIDRQYFSITWAESRPKTQHEHNVAIVFPVGQEFTDGLLFDPWRTGGKPFWRAPLKDKHFYWKRWLDYGIY